MDNGLYDVIITPDAESDLTELGDYIAYELLSPGTAIRYVKTIREAILSLSFMPERYPIVDFEYWRELGMRHFSVKNFNVYYYIVDDISSVFVANVIYKKRDQLKALDNRNRF